MHTLGSLLLLTFLVFQMGCGRSETSSLLGGESKAALADQLHNRLVTLLENNYPEDEGSVWASADLSLEQDWIIQSPEGLWGADKADLSTSLDCSLRDARCDKDFRRLSCDSQADCTGMTTCEDMIASVHTPGQEPARLCISHADRVVNRVYRTMVQAERELDFVSLSLPTGRFRKAVVNALAYLSQSPSTPKIRMLFSGAAPALPNLLQSPKKVLNGFIGDVAEITPNAYKLQINLAWLSVGRLSWNHAKIIVADGDLAISGGHNLWDKDYLSANPVFDISLEYRGEAAEASRDFVNTLWTHIGTDYHATDAARGLLAPFRERAKTSGDVKAISLGRLGILGANPSDDVLNAMIDNAKYSVFIDQQDLYNQIISPLTKTFVFDSLVKAALRGVKIKIVQSNNFPLVGGYGSVNGDKVYKALVDAGTKVLRARGVSRSLARQTLCENIEYAPFRFSKNVHQWPYKNATVGTHSKLMIVDEAGFYIGSHNLYPANLQEHGMVITDAKATEELLAQYWDKVWGESSPSRFACPD